ncbi:MAG TPA: hypothetical protein VHE79_15145, partial [Spirochaetia bacterium]
YLRTVGYEEETQLEITGGCPLPVWLWDVTQVPTGGDTVVAPGVPGESRIFSIEEQEGGRAQMVVKCFDAGGRRDCQPAPYACRRDTRDACGELACASPTLSGGGRLRVSWKTRLCAFSGRREEIHGLRARITGAP